MVFEFYHSAGWLLKPNFQSGPSFLNLTELAGLEISLVTYKAEKWLPVYQLVKIC
jgi:hypothetical protein